MPRKAPEKPGQEPKKPPARHAVAVEVAIKTSNLMRLRRIEGQVGTADAQHRGRRRGGHEPELRFGDHECAQVETRANLAQRIGPLRTYQPMENTKMDLSSSLMTAAIGGIMAGAFACGGSTPPPVAEAMATVPSTESPTTPSASDASPAPASNAADSTDAKHDCKGKNACKGQGGCKTDQHACKGQNACKGQGGCKM